EEITLIEPYHYVKLSKILYPPKLSVNEIDRGVVAVLPYIRQKVKMWGAQVLKAESIKILVDEDDDASDISDTDEADDFKDKKNILSRFDCIASLLASAECTVAQDIFRTLSQFPIAFPLIMPKLNRAKKFKVMIPLFTGPVIKWETSPGKIIENHLFNDPFKLIVAIRIGTNSQGKSTILNQLMASNFMFSSCSEPRAEYGVPHMISGSVEFTWLTQETCGAGLWNDVFENFYKGEAKEIVLLANLHGDALDYPEQIEYLNQFPSSFLVFLMPGCTENQIAEFEAIVDPEKVVYGCVNHRNFPDKNPSKKKYTIDIKSLTKDKTLKKVRTMFKEALSFDTSLFNAEELRLGRSLQLTEGTELNESQYLIDFVKGKTCRHVKLEVMQLQRKQLNNGMQIWQNSTELQLLVHLYINILKLPLGKRRRALAHLEREVSRLSMLESSEVRNQAILKREELRKSNLVNRNQENEKKIREEIAQIWAEVDNMSLGMEHFFRELGQLYKIFLVYDPSNDIGLRISEYYAELLISGHTIELLDGDAGTICEAWFSAICGHVNKKFPDLRVFVISILGLQSSGKSTLLNALFACRFAVSVGRCTRGLFMRLLFLEKDLSDQLNIDAIILIDTEGLGAPEKMNDPDSEKKDRILATFAMGVSNLTILNVLGESMRDLTEILQIAIVTMARLEKAGIAPDILMVQHISERNASRLSEPEEKFRDALQEALKIAEEQDIEMGISNTECLQILDERIKKGQLLKQFRPFKNGATAYAPPSEQYHEDVVNLYNSIIDDCKNSQRKIKFLDWYLLTQNYWNAISHEDFTVRFKNIREIYEFIDLGKQITKLKETIDRAFLKHEELIMQKIRSELQDWNADDNSNVNLRIREKCLELVEKGVKDVTNCGNSNCTECEKVKKERIELEDYLGNKNNEKCETETKQTIENYVKLNRESSSIKLNQMLEAGFIRKGISSDSFEIINKQLEMMLRGMPSGRLSSHQREQKVKEIWDLLRDHIISKNNVIPVTACIDNEFESVYELMPQNLRVKYKYGVLPNFFECPAYKKYHISLRCLQDGQIIALQEKLDNLADLIFAHRESRHFYTGIMRDAKMNIDKILTGFSKSLLVTFLPDFKWNVHLYALLKFKPVIVGLQKIWNKENTPLGMFDQKKEEYLKVIDTMLRYDHTLVSEGHICGDYLLRVINKKAMNAGDNERVVAVRDIPWLTCAESIRLKYFEKLGEQVKNGDKEEAMRYFSGPKRCIENWFRNTVDNYAVGNPQQKFDETFDDEFHRVLQDIRNCKSFDEIKRFVNDYMTQVDNIDYQLNFHSSFTKEDFKIFHLTVEEELRTKGNNRYPKQEPFQEPSKNKSVMERLGCTEACHRCGALCWGSRDHHLNSGVTKLHHTSHQPEGLTGMGYLFTRNLVAVQCHKWKDNQLFYNIDGTCAGKWAQVKTQFYSDWKFEPHCTSHFNDLMCWFLEKLRLDLAKARNVKPPTRDELRRNGCLNLNYDNIISILRTRVGKT
ncbi:10068_t:CDS:1, partial [Acaulospora morrowiae]